MSEQRYIERKGKRDVDDATVKGAEFQEKNDGNGRAGIQIVKCVNNPRTE